MIAIAGPVPYGDWPRPAKATVAAHECTSEASVASSPYRISGGRYPGVPSSQPVWVSLGSSATRARPKSMRIGRRPSMRTLEGFTSRCSTPHACTLATPSASERANQLRSAPRIGPSSCTWSCREYPGT